MQDIKYIVSYKKYLDSKEHTKKFSSYLMTREFVKDLFREALACDTLKKLFHGDEIIVAVYDIQNENHMDSLVEKWKQEVVNE